MRLGIGSVVGLLLLVGCGDDSVPGGRPSGPDVAIEGRWVPRDIPSGEFGPAYRPEKAPLVFAADGTWTAWSGPCNRPYSGTYEMSGSSIDASGPDTFVIGTDCLGGTVPYQLVLDTAREVAIVDGRLELRDSDGALVARFDPAKPAGVRKD